jgi:hypothetical protein
MTRALVPPQARPLTPAPRGLVQRQCACGGTPGPDGECAGCKRKRLLRLASGPALASPPPLVDDVLRSAGRPLDAATRGSMETRFAPYSGLAASRPALAASRAVSRPGDTFEREAERVAAELTSARPSTAAEHGADFSRVRVHTDDRAAASARAVDAHAYTVGSHIVFDRGRYAPATPAGQRLLAHELAHVVQQGEAPGGGPILRQAKCDHDPGTPGCGYAWRFEGFKAAIGVDKLIVDSLDRNLPGRWVHEVQSPYNPRKRNASDRGRVDALKVIEAPAELRLEIVEIKSRAAGEGCTRAADEAGGYKIVYDRIVPQILALSRAAEQLGGVRVPEGGRLTAGQRRQLQALGIDLTDPRAADAFRFWNSLQNRLDTTYTRAFANVVFEVNQDGQYGRDYSAIKVLRDCVRKGVVKTGTIELLFQVNKEGGISYRCESECPEDDDDRKRKRPQPDLRPDKRKGRRPRVEVQEGEPRGDQPELPDQPPIDAPPADAPADQPTVDRPEIRDQPPHKPEIKHPPSPKPDVTPPAQKAPSDQPVAAQPGGNFQGVPELVVSAAALHQLAKQVLAQRAAGRLAASEAAAALKVIEKQYIEVVDEIAKSAPKIAKQINGHNAGQLGKEVVDDALKAGAKEADEIALKVASRGGVRAAVSTVARVAVVLAIVMDARDAIAAVNHLRKGGTIRIGLGGDEVELVGDTKITRRNQDPLAKMDVRGDASLRDTVIDIDMAGIPSLKGRADIQAENVTIRQAGVLSNGDPITVNIHAKLKNTTVTITHQARFQDGKAVIGGEAIDMSDTNIEIDLPPDVTLPERQRKPGEPVSLKGVNMKITEVPATPAAGTPGGPGGAAKQPGTAPTPASKEEQKPVDKPGEKPPEKVDPAAKYKDLDEATRQKIREAGKPVQTLFDELTKPDPKIKGLPITNETVKRFYDTVPANLTDAQLEALRKRMVPITTDDPDAWFQALSDAVAAVRKPADDALKKEGEPGKDKPTVTGEPEKDKPDEEKAELTAAEIFDMYEESYKRLKPGGWVIDWSAGEKAADKRRKKGEKIKPERDAVYLGKTDDDVKLFATLRVRIVTREKKRGTLKILSVGNVIDPTGATRPRPRILTGDIVSGKLGW